MADTICSECGTSFSATCAACQRTALFSIRQSEPEAEEIIITYEEPVAISPELDAWMILADGILTGILTDLTCLRPSTPHQT